MGVMLYKQGRGTKVWGKEVQAKVVDDSDVEDHLADGWLSIQMRCRRLMTNQSASHAWSRKTWVKYLMDTTPLTNYMHIECACFQH